MNFKSLLYIYIYIYIKALKLQKHIWESLSLSLSLYIYIYIPKYNSVFITAACFHVEKKFKDGEETYESDPRRFNGKWLLLLLRWGTERINE